MSLDIMLFAINHPKMTSDKNYMCDILAVYAKALVNAYLDNNVFHYKNEFGACCEPGAACLDHIARQTKNRVRKNFPTLY